MRKRIFSVFLAVAMIFCLIPLSAHAEHQHTFENKHGYDLTNLPEGYSIPCKIYESPCSSECGYSLYSWDVFGLSGQFVDKSGTSGLVVYQHYREWFEKIYGKNASAKKYETGGGSAGTGGVGRRPSGYSENNTPDVTQAGVLHFYAPVTGWDGVISGSYSCSFSASNPTINYGVASANATGSKFPADWTGGGNRYVRVICAFTAPVSGTYWVNKGDKVAVYRYVYNGSWQIKNLTVSSAVSRGYAKGDTAFFSIASTCNAYYPFDAEGYGIDIYVTPLTSTINQTNSITINQNVWNGNIYQDNSTNLTYIYPQYTTINENNETVTNISNNPIIYNNETKQYYTYDTVTNNYYYITYETPTPSPSPSPDPTPTPEPGGDTGDTSGIMKILQEIKAVLVSGFAGITEKLQNIGVGGSTPETAKPGSSSGNKGQSWWEKLLGKIGDAIVDGLLGAISAVLKLIFKLFTTILGWIIWLVSQVLTLFPFLPPGLGALLIGGVVVCFIIGLIKFIRG